MCIQFDWQTIITLIGTAITLLGVIVPIIIYRCNRKIKLKEIANNVIWRYGYSFYQPFTQQFEESLSFSITNIYSEPIKIIAIKYSFCCFYKFPIPIVSEPNETIKISLIPEIPDILKYSHFYIISKDNKGYEHSTIFKIIQDKNECNVRLQMQ